MPIMKLHQLNPQERAPSDNNSNACRICLLDTMPLAQVCGCSGSIKYIHPACIEEWLTVKIEEEEGEFINVPHCEICNEPYDLEIMEASREINWKCLWQKLCQSKGADICKAAFYIALLSLAIVSLFHNIFMQIMPSLSSNLVFKDLNLFAVFQQFIAPSFIIYKALREISELIEDYKNEALISSYEIMLNPRQFLQNGSQNDNRGQNKSE